MSSELSVGRHDPGLRYMIALAIVFVAFACRAALLPVLGDQAPYLFFVPAVLLAAGLCGAGPGILATCLSLPLILAFIAEPGTIGWAEGVNSLAFLIIGFGATWIGERLRQGAGQGRHVTSGAAEPDPQLARLQRLQSELAQEARQTAMGELAEALAHELNQPLAAIANYLKGAQRLLGQDRTDKLPTVCDALDRAAGQAMRAGEIIRHLRDAVGRSRCEPAPESLARLVDESVALALLGASDTPVNLTLDLAAQLDCVMVDRGQIQQVLINLVSNAVEAMDETATRELSISATPAGAGMVAVQVDDTGCGIAPSIAGELFQPFVTTKPNGMGVGLSIARTIVEAHGGSIAAWSRPGGGTTLRFTLPLAGEAGAH